jgi:hypothetical protein
MLQTGVNLSGAEIAWRESWDAKNRKRWGAFEPTESRRDSTTIHEMGHSLTTKTFEEKFRTTAAANGAESLEWFRTNISEYAATSLHEAISESFARIMRPEYRKGEQPKWLEDLCEELLRN